MSDKEKIRANIKKMRASLTKDDVRVRSEAILQRLIKTEVYQKTSWLFAYMSFKNEADTRALIERALEDGKRVALPKVSGKALMDFYEIRSLSETAAGTMGILEPLSNISVIPGKAAACSEILMIVPGLAFDFSGRRIGWGGGFYDIYLSKYKDIVTAGLSYDFQIYPSIPADVFDRTVDMIVTEKEVLMPLGY